MGIISIYGIHKDSVLFSDPSYVTWAQGDLWLLPAVFGLTFPALTQHILDFLHILIHACVC